MPLTEPQVGIVHDHYKESFTLIREREGQRDKLFLWLLLFYALLILEVQFPANANGVLGSLNVAGNTLNLQQVPLGLLLDASWVFLAAFVLKYCQVATAIERQYDYVHMLEGRMSSALKDDRIYRREGAAYLSRYPWLLRWAWLSYTAMFPAALVVATIYLFAVEVAVLHHGLPSKIFDGVFVASIVVSVSLYRFLPGILRAVRHFRKDKGDTELSYLDEIAEKIAGALREDPGDATPPELLRLYALLVLAKGEQTTAADVHNAWAAWMQERQPDHPDIEPFRTLDADTKHADDPFVAAIHTAARSMAGTNK